MEILIITIAIILIGLAVFFYKGSNNNNKPPKKGSRGTGGEKELKDIK